MQRSLAPAAEDPCDITATVVLSVIAVATFLVLPQFVTAAVEDLHFSERQAGLLSAFLMSGTAVAALAAGGWVRRVHWRWAAGIALCGLVVTNLASLRWHGVVPFMALQCAAGFFGGSLYSLCLTMLSDSHHPDRNFGYSVAAQVAFQVIGLLTGPALIRHGGVNALLELFTAMSAIGLLLAVRLPSAQHRAEAAHAFARLLNARIALALLGCFLFFFNVGCYWTYVDLIGAASGLSTSGLANGLAIGVAFGIAGGLLASWLGERRGRLLPIAVSAVVTIVAVLLLKGHVGIDAFVGSAVLYNVAWNLSLTYQYSTVNAVDRSGCAIAVAPAFHSAGAAAGPALAALLVSPRDHTSVIWLVCTSVIASLACFAAASGSLNIGQRRMVQQ